MAAALLVAAVGAWAVPMLLTYSTPPSSTFINQAAAFAGWGVLMAVLAMSTRVAAPIGARPGDSLEPGIRMAWPVPLALAMLLIGIVASTVLGGLPVSLAGSSAATVLAAALVFCGGVQVGRASLGPRVMAACALALVLAGLVSSLVAAVQIFLPGLTQTGWLPAAGIAGRAAGSLRQPNHLSTLMLWALVAAVWCGEAGLMRRWLAVLLMVAFALAVVLTGSRTGLLGLVVLALWGLVDRSWSRGSRASLASLPLVYGLGWWLLGRWMAGSSSGIGEADRFGMQGDVSSARFSIWSDTIDLIRAHPWFGVGFGEFNFAWTLTPSPGRSGLFFDHAHNLPLHLLAELGMPLGAAVVGLLCMAFWRAFRAAGRASAEPEARVRRAAFMMLLLMAVHSLLEYPLWYAYFLLPTAFLLGLCLGEPSAPAAPAAERGSPAAPVRWLQMGAALLLAGSVMAVVDYWKVVLIFSPGESSTRTLSERIEAGRRSLFFAHHAHYAAATTALRPSEVMDSFRQASHFLLDTRLMLAWAQAFAEAGDRERARHLADRLREFDNDASRAFFAACLLAPPPGGTRPFQCEPATLPMDERAFR